MVPLRSLSFQTHYPKTLSNVGYPMIECFSSFRLVCIDWEPEKRWPPSLVKKVIQKNKEATANWNCIADIEFICTASQEGCKILLCMGYFHC